MGQKQKMGRFYFLDKKQKMGRFYFLDMKSKIVQRNLRLAVDLTTEAASIRLIINEKIIQRQLDLFSTPAEAATAE